MDDSQPAKELSFIATLATDIERALHQAEVSNAGSDRRNALRTIISAMEGAAWIYRMHVLSVARGIDMSTPRLEFAFSETVLFVSEQGEIKEQRRFVSTTAMIRLATKTAQEMCPHLKIDFMNPGWQKLKDSIRLRNRITHPKNLEDLVVSRRNLDDAKMGFDWFLTTVADVMEVTLKEFSAYAADAKDIIEKLSAGDPDTIALYERARRESDD
ncbi:hypothetical protein [Sphingobium chlorophenolicum]|nr:hypothetical protein [Sphingobium chlorophenolicum]